MIGDDLVALVEQDAFGRDLLGVEGEGHDGDDLTGADEVSGGTVDDDVSRLRLAGDDVGLQARTTGDAGDEYFFADPKIDSFHQVGGNGDAAFVIDIGIGDAGTMDFGFELMAKHGSTM